MNILFHNFYDSLNKGNYLFNELNTSIGDNLLAPFHELKKLAFSKNIKVGTSDVMNWSEADALVFVDYPDISNRIVSDILKSKILKYLVVFESPLIRQLPSKDILLKQFDRIFIYDDTWVDGDRFLKINYSFELPETTAFFPREQKKLLTLIAGNKKSNAFGELYSKRREAIQWFEKNAPDEFDLYGVGWDLVDFGSSLPWRIFNRSVALRKFFSPRLVTFKGAIERKAPVLCRYQFAICYENVANIPGYITEKSFDCFLAGCIPIYWGANNIGVHIPNDCYIDKTQFTSFEELYSFIKTMNDVVYSAYLDRINSFISGDQVKAFSVQKFSQTILDPILKDFGGENP